MTETMLQNYVDGRFGGEPGGRLLDVTNPATGAVLSRVSLSDATEVDRAVQAARRGFERWRWTPASQRVTPLFKLVSLLREQEERIARVLVAEMGKSLADARAELKRAIENVEVACGVPVLQQGDVLVGAAQDIDGEVLRLPVGVFGIIAPFNFPLMVPFWFIPTAIAAGNAVVVKPSEQVPMTLAVIAELVDACGLPPGVFNVVNGDREAAVALTAHPGVSGISFVGSTAVGRVVVRTCVESDKRFQVLGSAKNHLVVLPDADMEGTIRNMLSSCYGCAGQRCMAASAIVAVGDATYAEVRERFLRASHEVLVANPLDDRYAEEPMLMGPVISAAARERIEGLIQRGVDEGATLALDGRGVRVAGSPGGHYVGPTVLAEVEPGMEVHRTEIFGPVVVLLRAASLDQAIGIINGHRYGNGASIYTRSGHAARRFKLEVEAGMIGVNVGIPAPVAHLPFGGMKDSLLSPIKTQGIDNLDFFTDRKVVTTRFPE